MIATEFSPDEYPFAAEDGFGNEEVKVIAPAVYAGGTSILNSAWHYSFAQHRFDPMNVVAEFMTLSSNSSQFSHCLDVQLSFTQTADGSTNV